MIGYDYIPEIERQGCGSVQALCGNEEHERIRACASVRNGKIEDELDLAAYNIAMETYKADPVTYSHDDVKKMLGL